MPDFHFRSFWMSTSYRDEFRDDFALGTSLQLGGKLNAGEKFQLHLGYRVFANLWSSDIAAPEPITGQLNRYELGLFDLLDPEDRFFGKLEILSLGYTDTNWGVKLGRFGINTDWINPQDGRLTPTAVEGVSGWFQTEDNWKFSVWGISRMSIRGSSEWLGIGESIGLFPVGRSTAGRPSAYGGNTSSDWVGILEVSKRSNVLDFKYSQTLAENLFNSSMLELRKEFEKPESGSIWQLAVQGGFQTGLGDGGNENPELRFKDPADRNWSSSFQTGITRGRWKSNLNYTKVGGTGRWLSPREWGKDPWFTFIPRERNEGFTKVDAATFYLEYSFPNPKILVYTHFGFHWLPSPDNAPANKYAFPSYRQLNLGLKYQLVSRMDFHLLVMNKEPLFTQELSAVERYNKIELIHINAILNWRWN